MNRDMAYELWARENGVDYSEGSRLDRTCIEYDKLAAQKRHTIKDTKRMERLRKILDKSPRTADGVDDCVLEEYWKKIDECNLVKLSFHGLTISVSATELGYMLTAAALHSHSEMDKIRKRPLGEFIGDASDDEHEELDLALMCLKYDEARLSAVAKLESFKDDCLLTTHEKGFYLGLGAD